MAFVITGGCCADSSCIPVCPVQCIRPRPGDADFGSVEQLYIDPASCIDCGACQEECPVDAVLPEWELPGELAEYVDVNAGYFVERPIIEALSADFRVRRLADAAGALRVAVVGSGPAACYAVEELAALGDVSVTVLERLPTPYGLVRAGVAPDHQRTKQVADRFAAALERPNVTCYLNVEVGLDIGIDELLQHHHAVVWAGGASADRRLGVPGEDLLGVHAAREVVAWYNGHPDHADRVVDLSVDRAIVLGNGNVALDVARVLAQPVERLVRTDAADHALAVLARSRVSEIVVVARRGPEHAAFTTAEIADLERLDGVDLVAHPDEVGVEPVADRRRAGILQRAAARVPDSGNRVVRLRFGLTPRAIDGDGRVDAVEFVGADGGVERIDAGLVLRAVGYRGQPVPGLPFDELTGTLPHREGRLLDAFTGRPLAGVYCSGWIKRGATGVIGSNRVDAAETVAALVDDFEAGRLPVPVGGASELDVLMRSRCPDVIDKAGWHRIDEAERAAGRTSGRPRVKLVSVEALVAAAPSP